ncbi:MAG: hypothetical protein GF372_02990 [Candidatus Marinimicrobia bacterium]|nr:hypothetical protein [Candidatus Neomarinimicrobiota bacterium]
MAQLRRLIYIIMNRNNEFLTQQKYLMIRYFLINFIILFLYSNYIYSEDIILENADNFLVEEEYDQAITEYKRYLFYNSEDTVLSPVINYKIGLCFKYLKQFERAREHFTIAQMYANSDSLYFNASIEKIVTNLAGENFNTSYQQLLMMSGNLENARYTKKLQLYMGINETLLHKWDEAEKSFAAYFNQKNSVAIDSIFRDKEKLQLKNPNLAWKMSLIFPGLGQIYGGDYYTGIKSIGLNILFFYTGYQSIITQNYFNTVLSSSMILNRYINGNRDNAAEITEDYNQTIRNEYTQKILEDIKYALEKE